MPEMQTPQTPPTTEPLRRIVDSTLAIGFARFFMPVALAVIGWFMTTAVADMKAEIRDGNAAVWLAVKTLSVTVNGQATDIATLKARAEYTGKAVDRLTTIIDGNRK